MTAHVADVTECDVDTCSFNHDHDCTAYAITIGGRAEHASCATFIDTSAMGGLPKVLAHVGACQRSECTYNNHLMCDAEKVHVGQGAEAADCLTYQPR